MIGKRAPQGLLQASGLHGCGSMGVILTDEPRRIINRIDPSFPYLHHQCESVAMTMFPIAVLPPLTRESKSRLLCGVVLRANFLG